MCISITSIKSLSPFMFFSCKICPATRIEARQRLAFLQPADQVVEKAQPPLQATGFSSIFLSTRDESLKGNIMTPVFSL